jgi:hypothetical protein
MTVIWFPFLILTVLCGLIAFCGKYSSKNITRQHKIFLSFYCLVSVLDVLAMWSQFILFIPFGGNCIFAIAFPFIALCFNYWLNYKYHLLWNELDPEKPKDDDALTRAEVARIYQSDEWFDKWNFKYYKEAGHVYRVMVGISHKFFMMPYTHFLGYASLTLRTQDHYRAWQWLPNEVRKFASNRIT